MTDSVVASGGSNASASPYVETGRLTPAQLSNWMYACLVEERGGPRARSDVANVVSCVEFEGVLAKSALEDAVTAVWSAHPALRATLEQPHSNKHQEPLARVLPPGPPQVSYLRVDPNVGHTQLLQLISDLSMEPLDLRTASYRIQALEGVDRWFLVIVIDHTFTDGYSSELVRRLVCCGYADRQGGRSIEIRPGGSFIEIGKSHREWINSHDGEAEIEQLRTLLLPEPPQLALRTRVNRATHHTPYLDHVVVPAEPGLGPAMRAAAAAERTTLHSFVMAAFVAALAQHSPGGDVAIGQFALGRWWSGAFDDVGCFTCPTIVRTTVDASTHWSDHLKIVSGINRENLHRHQRVPTMFVTDKVRSGRGGGPLNQSWFSMTDTPASTSEPASWGRVVTLPARPLELRLKKSDPAAVMWQDRNPTMHAAFNGDQLELQIQFDRVLFDEDVARELAEAVLGIARAASTGAVPPSIGEMWFR